MIIGSILVYDFVCYFVAENRAIHLYKTQNVIEMLATERIEKSRVS